MGAEFSTRIDHYRERIGHCLERTLPAADESPRRLHEAMRYAVLNGGKRIRPLLAYASGECLGVGAEFMDGPATAIELIHAFSLIHDDLPAMDDDDLRRGAPTVHRKFDEATAILAADALQPLAFAILAAAPGVAGGRTARLVRLIAEACGSRGMTGGQSIDLSSEGKTLSVAELEHMYELKTGALIRAAVMSACCLTDELDDNERAGLEQFGRTIGLAFQIRDDILDIEGETQVIGKHAGADERRAKATWPGLFGVARARQRCDELLRQSVDDLQPFGESAAPLSWLAHYIVERPR